jgi:hypothetical protein
MKNTLILILTVTTIALGGVCLLQWQKLSGHKADIASLRGEMEQKAQAIADLEASQKFAEQQRRELLDQASDLAIKLQTRPPTDAKNADTSASEAASPAENQKSEKDKNPFGGFLAKLMEDPDTKKMIRDQQRMMLDQLYAPLVKQLNLTPEDAEQFKNLLADNMMKATEKATSLMGGDSATNRTEMLGKLAEEQKGFEETVRGFLGETGYAQYKDYQQTVGERTQLSQFQQQFAGGENALSDQQTERLLQFMKEEKQAVATATGQPTPGTTPDAATMDAMFSGEGVEKMLQSQEAVNQRVYERAKEVLSENQLGPFGKFQTNQLQMMRMGMSMAKKFMAPEKADVGAPAPNP